MEIIEYIEEQIKGFKINNHVRFELGDTLKNGSDERLNQVNYRVKALFDSLIDKDDEIILYIFDYESGIDPMFGNTTPDYVYDLLSHLKFEESVYIRYDEDEDVDGSTIQLEHRVRVFTCKTECCHIAYEKLFEGIGNYEQGREPSIGQSLFFMCPKQSIIFNMYDDRGCIIHGQNFIALKKLYIDFNDWIVEYWRSYYDEIYKDS